jgi:hypothetical protein
MTLKDRFESDLIYWNKRRRMLQWLAEFLLCTIKDCFYGWTWKLLRRLLITWFSANLNSAFVIRILIKIVMWSYTNCALKRPNLVPCFQIRTCIISLTNYFILKMWLRRLCNCNINANRLNRMNGRLNCGVKCNWRYLLMK